MPSANVQPEQDPLPMRAIVGIDGCFVCVNTVWQQTLGWDGTDLVATPFIERVHPDDLDTVVAAIHFLHGGGQETSFVCRYRRRDGTYTWLTWDARLVSEQFLLDLQGTVKKRA